MNLHHDKEAFEELIIGAANELSAKPGVCVSEKLHEIIDSQVYREDYEDITLGLLFVPETYDTAIQSLQQIADSGLWD